MIEQIESYLQSLGGNNEVLNWLQTAGKKALKSKKSNISELEHIVDYLVSDSAPSRLKRMSFEQAKRKSKEWSEANQKKGRDLIDSESDLETIHDFKDGRKIVKLLTKQALQREGFLMNHCVGGYSPDSTDYDIYSYRDENNNPHATFEVRKNSDEIVQIKGKGNGPIHPKYIHPILEFLRAIGMDIRPSDMKNLGYHHIDKSHVEFLNQIPGAREQMTEINGEYYAF